MSSKVESKFGLDVQKPHVVASFTRPPICKNILDHASPGEIVYLGKTCRVAHDDVLEYYRDGLNINRHVARFFEDPIAFRNFQARIGTLISGSIVLQFLDRTFYQGSDLDLYVHPDCTGDVGIHPLNERYDFLPSSYQPGDFEGAVDCARVGTAYERRRYGDRSETEVDVWNEEMYDALGVDTLWSFQKAAGIGQSLLKEVKIITATFSPFYYILNFHSIECSY